MTHDGASKMTGDDRTQEPVVFFRKLWKHGDRLVISVPKTHEDVYGLKRGQLVKVIIELID